METAAKEHKGENCAEQVDQEFVAQTALCEKKKIKVGTRKDYCCSKKPKLDLHKGIVLLVAGDFSGAS